MSEIKPGSKVTITIEATIIQTITGPVHIVYGDGHELVIRPGEPGVSITANAG
jgi:hypothetical protein